MNVKKDYEEYKVKHQIRPKKYFRRQLSFLNIYNIIAQYGNSVYRPIYALTLIIVISTISFLTDEFTNINKIVQHISIQDIIDASIRSAAGFIPFTATKEINATDVILKILILPILGTLYIAFKRKFERIIRH